jgi:hypothetical protein
VKQATAFQRFRIPDKAKAQLRAKEEESGGVYTLRAGSVAAALTDA